MNIKNFILLIIFIIINIYSKKKKHSFWDTQPVTRENPEENKIINKNISELRKEPKLPNTIKKKKADVKNIKRIMNFLNENYIRGTKYSKSYLSWLFNFPYSQLISRNMWNMSFVNKKDELIGIIFGRPILLSVNGSIEDIIYVDMLCIHKKCRNLGLTPLLIKSFIHSTISAAYPSYIFIKENSPLPYKYFFKTQYYIKPLYNAYNTPSYLKLVTRRISDKKIEDIYAFFMKHNSKYLIHRIFTLKEFKYRFNTRNNIIYSFYTEENEQITGFISVLHTFWNLFSEEKIIGEIQYIFGTEVVPTLELVKQVITVFKEHGFDYLCILNMKDYDVPIDMLHFTKAEKLFFHTYNYDIPLVSYKDISFMVS